MRIEVLPCGAYAANAYLVWQETREDCVLIDAGDDISGIKAMLEKSGQKLSAILLTHGHFDHTLAAQPIAEAYQIPVYLHEKDKIMLCDSMKNAHMTYPYTELRTPKGLDAVAYGETLDIAGIKLRVLHTPGHTKGSVCLYAADENTMFTGDTLFAEGFGRSDFFGGSAREMLDSLKMLFEMDGDIRIYPGHGEASTIAHIRGRYHR